MRDLHIKHTLHLCLLFAALFSLSGVFSSCKKEPKIEAEPTETQYINYFSKNATSQYYLWNEEIATYIKNWDLQADPVKNVEKARYSENGKEVDRWTTLMEDYRDFENSIAGEITGTYGFDFVLYYYDESRTRIIPVITVVYEGGPAQKAGLKRGDAIGTINGKTLTVNNYVDVLYKGMLYASSASITLLNGTSEIKLSAEKMYEDPVFPSKVFNAKDKKIGYLIYNSFTAASCERLIEECKKLKSEGVTELILDLRYNSGGLASAEQLLGSMLAPQKAVDGKEIYGTDVYNKNLAPYYGTETRFTTDFEITIGSVKHNLSTAGANIGLKKIYFITTSSTASASEALICCLSPYVDYEVIGEKTHGKFCSGIIYPAGEWFDDYKDQIDYKVYQNGKKFASSWGIYVMIGRYADKNGKTLSMPDGINPTIASDDIPLDGYQLGDERETMISVALAKAGYVFTPSFTLSSVKKESTLIPSDISTGKRVEGRILEEKKIF